MDGSALSTFNNNSSYEVDNKTINSAPSSDSPIFHFCLNLVAWHIGCMQYITNLCFRKEEQHEKQLVFHWFFSSPAPGLHRQLPNNRVRSGFWHIRLNTHSPYLPGRGDFNNLLRLFSSLLRWASWKGDMHVVFRQDLPGKWVRTRVCSWLTDKLSPSRASMILFKNLEFHKFSLPD